MLAAVKIAWSSRRRASRRCCAKSTIHDAVLLLKHTPHQEHPMYAVERISTSISRTGIARTTQRRQPHHPPAPRQAMTTVIGCQIALVKNRENHVINDRIRPITIMMVKACAPFFLEGRASPCKAARAYPGGIILGGGSSMNLRCVARIASPHEVERERHAGELVNVVHAPVGELFVQGPKRRQRHHPAVPSRRLEYKTCSNSVGSNAIFVVQFQNQPWLTGRSAAFESGKRNSGE